jgi:lipopolysaccharide export system permease protein
MAGPFGWLGVLDRMIAVDLIKTVSAILAVLVIIIVSQKFIKVLAQAIEGNIANQTVFMLLGLKTIIVTSSFLPAAVFMSVLIVMGRMYKEQEIAAINSAGGGLFFLYRGIFLLLLPVTALAVALSMYAAPWAETKTQELMHDDRQTADVRGISAGRFSEYSRGELIFYTERVDDDGKMHNVFLQNKEGEKTGIVNAEFGKLKILPGGLYLILQNGQRVLGDAGDKDFILEKFQEYAVHIDEVVYSLNLSSQALATRELLYSNDLQNIAEFQNRLNTSLAVILLAIIGAPLARMSPRGGIYGSLLIAFGIYFIYGNLQRLNYSWIVGKVIPYWLGYFWLSGLLALLGVFLVMRYYGWHWMWRQFRKGLGL